ncbi:hypothetical protein APX70_01731 [Pseudomonas syringae pv. maculicola]|uniref:Uncharacterized protein n=1 Tax=Pseudomonas syringae pv. maculicola TaxID=59511 RepID=A0A3M2UM77_PSEYM|nr:hypothetical protein APX70_01731 [Pseudomonas syringae pv. maculicola]
MSAVTVSHFQNELVGMGDTCRCLHLFKACVDVAVTNVVLDAAKKQTRRLRHHCKAATQVMGIELHGRHALDQNASTAWVVKTQQQVEDR